MSKWNLEKINYTISNSTNKWSTREKILHFTCAFAVIAKKLLPRPMSWVSLGVLAASWVSWAFSHCSLCSRRSDDYLLVALSCVALGNRVMLENSMSPNSMQCWDFSWNLNFYKVSLVWGYLPSLCSPGAPGHGYKALKLVQICSLYWGLSYYSMHRWGSLLPCSLAYGAGSHTSHRDTLVHVWMPHFRC